MLGKHIDIQFCMMYDALYSILKLNKGFVKSKGCWLVLYRHIIWIMLAGLGLRGLGFYFWRSDILTQIS